MKDENEASVEINHDFIFNKKRTFLINSYNYNFFCLALVSEKFFGLFFSLDILMNSRLISKRFFKKINLNLTFRKKKKMSEIFFQNYNSEKLFFFYYCVKSSFKTFLFLIFSESFLMFHLLTSPKKKPIDLKKLNIKIFQAIKIPLNGFFLQFIEFQKGACLKKKDKIRLLPEGYKKSTIHLFPNLIYQKKWNENFNLDSILVGNKKKKTFKKFFGNSVFTIKNEIKFQIYLKKAIKKIFFKNRRKFFFRNKQLSPSYFRIFKTSFQQLTIFLRYFFKVLTENLLSWITSLIRFENPNLNFLYFYIIKYFPSIYSKISEIAPPLFGSKFHFLIKKNLFWNYKDFIFRYDFKKNNNKSLTRENINFKKLNLLKDRSLFLKNLNFSKLKMTRDLDRFTWISKQTLTSNWIPIYNNGFQAKSIYSTSIRIDNIKKKIKMKTFNSFNSIFFYSLKHKIERSVQNSKFIYFLGFVVSNVFNVRNNDTFLKIFWKKGTIFWFEYFFLKIKNVKRLHKVFQTMKKIEKKFLKKIFELNLFKEYSISNFFFRNFLEIKYINLKKINNQIGSNFFFSRQFLNFTCLHSLKFHPYNLFSFIACEMFTSFLSRRLDEWIFKIKESFQIVHKIMGISFQNFRKTYKCLKLWFNFRFKEKFDSLEFGRRFIKIKFFLNNQMIALLFFNKKKDRTSVKSIFRKDDVLQSSVKEKFNARNIKKIFWKKEILQKNLLITVNCKHLIKRELFLLLIFSIFLFGIKKILKIKHMFLSMKFLLFYILETDLLGELEVMLISKIEFITLFEKLFKSRFKAFSSYDNSSLVRKFIFLKKNLCKNSEKKNIFEKLFVSSLNEPLFYSFFKSIFRSIQEKENLSYIEKNSFSNKKFLIMILVEKLFNRQLKLFIPIIFQKVVSSSTPNNFINFKKFIYFLIFLIPNFDKKTNLRKNLTLLNNIQKFSDIDYKFFLQLLFFKRSGKIQKN